MTLRLFKLSLAVIGATISITSASLPVQAVSFVSQREALNANDKIDWDSLDFGISAPIAPDTIAKFVPYSFTSKSAKNLGYSVNIPVIDDPRFTTPFVFPVTPSLPVNFSLGDAVLFTGFIPGAVPAEGNPGPITIKFEQPVLGVGTQVGVDNTLEYILSIAVFDAQDNFLDRFFTPGISSLITDNSATFLGVNNKVANISKIVINSSVPNRALGINFLSVKYEAIPEPTTILALTLFGLSLLAIKPKIVSKHS